MTASRSIAIVLLILWAAADAGPAVAERWSPRGSGPRHAIVFLSASITSGWGLGLSGAVQGLPPTTTAANLRGIVELARSFDPSLDQRGFDIANHHKEKKS